MSSDVKEQLTVRGDMQCGCAFDKSQRFTDQGGGFLSQAVVIPADAIPLEHGEFGVMAAARFSVTEDAPQFVAVADTSSKETFQGVFRRSTQPTLCCSGITMPSKTGGEAVDVWLGISSGGEEGVSTSKTPRSARSPDHGV